MRLRILAAAALTIATAGTAHAQFFNAVYSKDGRDVIAVGDSGQVYRSLNGGATWVRSMVGARPLRDVAARGFSVVMVGDSGKIWRSTDSGGAWGLTVLSGIPALEALAWPSPDSLFVAGAGGALYRSVNGGQSWAAQTSQTSQRLRAIRFRDAWNGWAVGDGGTVIATTDGGQNWIPVVVPTTRSLHDVDFLGALVWVVGERGVALKSTNNGAGWTPQNLRLDAGSDVRVAWIQSPDTVYLAGGGGFVRRSADGGATWTFLQHTMQGALTDLHFAGGSGWMVNSATRLIPRTTNAGTTWTNPTSTVQRRTWVRTMPGVGTIRGLTLTLNPLDHKTLYMMMANTLYRSRDDGNTWSTVGSVSGATKANGFVISPKDTNVMLAAVGTPDRVVRSTDGGVSWTTVISAAFGEYGVPIEMHPDRPDTVYFGPDGAPLQMSPDFGVTWQTLGSHSFISPCDIVAVPESDSGLILVGDGVTSSSDPGRILRSNNGGLTFTVASPGVSGASEIPTMSSSRLDNTAAFASAWAGGQFKRSLDGGLTWGNVLNVSQTWGNDVCRDDPNMVVMGSYGATIGYLSFDRGATYLGVPGLGGSNYAVFVKDRSLVLFEQSLGVYKLAVSDSFPLAMSQSLAVVSPNGGEDWIAGSVHPVTWNAANVTLAKVEYRKSAGDPWQLVALVDGAEGSYAWTCPNDSTPEAQIRVSDAWDANPSDVSNAAFRIRLPRLTADPAAYDFGGVTPNTTAQQTLTLSNPGDAALEVTSIVSSNPKFWTGRGSLTLAAGASDTIGLYYRPTAAVPDTAVVTLSSIQGATQVPLNGHGSPPVGVGDGGAPLAFALDPNQPNPFSGRTLIRYALPTRERVAIDVYDIQGHRVARLMDAEQGPGRFTIPFGAGVGGRGLSAGVYFVRIEAGAFRASRKMLMLR